MKKFYLLLLIHNLIGLQLHSQVNKRAPRKKNSYIKTEALKLVLPNYKLRFPKTITILKKNSSANKTYKYKRKKGKYREMGKAKKRHSKKLKIVNEEAIFQFKKKSLRDGIGMDLFLFSKSKFTELEVYLSKNQKDWIPLGNCTAEKPYLDFLNLPKDKFTFVKIKQKRANHQEIAIDKLAIRKVRKGEIGVVRRIKGDQLTTKNDKVFLKIYDSGKIDADRVAISLNRQLIEGDQLLLRRNNFIPLPLEPGTNELIITALDEGNIGPTTVRIKIIDGITIYNGKFRLKKSKQGVITIHKGSTSIR